MNAGALPTRNAELILQEKHKMQIKIKADLKYPPPKGVGSIQHHVLR